MSKDDDSAQGESIADFLRGIFHHKDESGKDSSSDGTVHFILPDEPFKPIEPEKPKPKDK